MSNLTSIVTSALEARGVLGKIRAELRANVFSAIHEQQQLEGKTDAPSANLRTIHEEGAGRVAAQLVLELLRSALASRSELPPPARAPVRRRQRGTATRSHLAQRPSSSGPAGPYELPGQRPPSRQLVTPLLPLSRVEAASADGAPAPTAASGSALAQRRDPTQLAPGRASRMIISCAFCSPHLKVEEPCIISWVGARSCDPVRWPRRRLRA